MLVVGSFSLGFSTNVLPQAMATGNIHIGTIAGKLKGVMPATTPSGWRIEWLSTPVPTSSVNSPLSSCGMPVANSTTSLPRCTSPAASEATLPCSDVITAASDVEIALDQIAEPHEDARAAQRRRRRPGRERRGGRGDRRVHVGGVRHGHPARLAAGGRVVDVAEAARRAFMGLAADEMRRQRERGLGRRGWLGSAVELFDADMMC